MKHNEGLLNYQERIKHIVLQREKAINRVWHLGIQLEARRDPAGKALFRGSVHRGGVPPSCECRFSIAVRSTSR
jgi:hypothetical protein